MMISMIVAMGANRAIGKDNKLLWRLKADLQHFKAKTLGKTLVMGRKTYDSIGRPLPGRRTVVLTRDPNFAPEGVEIFHSVDEILALDVDEMVIGGGEQIYRLFLPFTQKLYLTKVAVSPEADAYFPELEGDWSTTALDHYSADAENEYDFEVLELVKSSVNVEA